MVYSEMPHAFEIPSSEASFYLPFLFEVLRQENLKPAPLFIESVKIVCEDANGNRFLMKQSRGTEGVIFAEAFPIIKEQNLPFRRLKLPEYRNIVPRDFIQDEVARHEEYILINFYDGTTFNDKWNEISAQGYGGRGLSPAFADKVLDLLDDLSLIDVSSITQLGLPTFNFVSWKNKNFPFMAEVITKREILNTQQIQYAETLMANPHLFEDSKTIFTNGDFYPRNIIELPNDKIVIIDWEGRQDYDNDQRTAPISVLENQIAFFFIHMWGNYAFQKRLIKGAVEKFEITAENLQAAILIKSLEQTIIWPDDLARRQAEIFTNALDINYIKDLMR